MPTTFSENLMNTAYKDDFSDSAGYKRILFNPRRALQARELTQSQTIIQKDIERFGRNIFKEGAMVNPGGISINNNIEFVKLQSTTSSGTPTYTWAEGTKPVAGSIFTGATSGVSAEVIDVIDGISGAVNLPTLYIVYRSGGAQTAAGETLRFTQGEDITIDGGSTTFKVKDNHNASTNPSFGKGVRLSVAAGDYFVQGHFCYAKPQSIIVEKYTNNFTGIVGFNVVQDIVTASDEDALFDNQGQFPNIAAPGADRYRITLTLIKKPTTVGLDTFMYIANIVNSIIVEQSTGFNQYNKINDLVAQRTSEESGDYVVNPFYLTYDSGNASTLNAIISPGKAYVNGNRISRPVQSQLSINKATSESPETAHKIGVGYGSYVEVTGFTGSLPMDPTEVFAQVNILGVADAIIGTCRVRHVDSITGSSNYRLFIFDIVMNSNKNFRSAKKIGSSTTKYSTLVLINSEAVLKEANNNNLFFEIPVKRPKSVSIPVGGNLRFMRKFSGTANSNTLQLTAATGEKFAAADDWIVWQDSGVVSAPIIGGLGTASATIGSLPTPTGNGTGLVEALTYVTVDNINGFRSKTLTTVTSQSCAIDSSTGIAPLGRNDIDEVTSIVNSAGDDLSSHFIVDNGQRDGFYDQGRLIRKTTSTDITGNAIVTFKHFSHSGSGYFFSVGSYAGIDYGDIPSYTMRDGTIVQLRDVLDFRSAKKSDGTFDDVGGASGGVVNRLPRNNTLIDTKIVHFLPRQDRVILHDTGLLENLEGVPSDVPTLPPLPPKSLELYRTSLNGGTISTSDMTVKFMENKGYTMKDIGKIDKRVDLLEETVSLSLLELDTNSLSILDSSGNNRAKSGFLVDNFKDLYHSDINNVEYKAAIDPKTMTLHPPFTENNIGLIYDADLSNGSHAGPGTTGAASDTILKGDNVYIKHTEVLYAEQKTVSRTENVNPFMISTYQGSMDLSPSSDEWKANGIAAAKVIDGGTKLNLNQSNMFNQSEWGWFGNDYEGSEVGNETQFIGTEVSSETVFSENTGRWARWGFDQTTSAIVNRVVASETIRSTLGSKVLDIAVIPFMRSRKISFRAIGLRPNAYHFAYLNDVKIDSFVRSTGTFARINTARTEYESPNRHVAHPDGASTLLSDVMGSISGTFFIPNNSTTKFRAGAAEFKLLDVTSNENNGGVPGSDAMATYNASGALHTGQEDVISTRHISIVGNNITTSSGHASTHTAFTDRDRSLRRGRNPLAQSFIVTHEEGIFVTKINLYFKTKHASLPVWIELRPLVNGYPASNIIVPGSRKYLIPGSEVGISTDASVASVFTFDEPVYLRGMTEYAIVCMSDNTDYSLWTSYMGDFELGSTSRRVTKQPFLGSFYKPQNSTTWETCQEQDLKFDLYRASFSTGVTAIAQLNNNDLPLAILGPNPITTTNTSSVIKVAHKDHNMIASDKVTLAGCTAVASITAAQLNIEHTVTDTDPTGYRITLAAGTANADTTGGGLVMTATKHIQGSTVYPIIQTLNPSKTQMTAKAEFYNGHSYTGIENNVYDPSGFNDIALNQKNYFENPVLIANAAKEVLLSNVNTGAIRIAMSTTSELVSPVIDLQRSSVVLTKNEVDYANDSAGGNVVASRNQTYDYAAETTAFSGTALAKHITKPVTLTSSAKGLKVIIAANRPDGADISVYYKTGTEDTILSEIPWTIANIDSPVETSNNPYTYKEHKYLIGGLNGDLNEFTTFQIKLVFYASNNSKVPTVKDMRVIALGV